ncbi:hypothetical protein HN511_03410 [bacterium]|nr:hypothetical protein [bacterium]
MKELREKPSIHTEKSIEVARCLAEPKRLSRITVASYAALKSFFFFASFFFELWQRKKMTRPQRRKSLINAPTRGK